MLIVLKTADLDYAFLSTSLLKLVHDLVKVCMFSPNISLPENNYYI